MSPSWKMCLLAAPRASWGTTPGLCHPCPEPTLKLGHSAAPSIFRLLLIFLRAGAQIPAEWVAMAGNGSPRLLAVPALRIVGTWDDPGDAGPGHPGTSDAGRSQGYTHATSPRDVGVPSASVGSSWRAVMEIRSLQPRGGSCRRVAARPRQPLSKAF